MMNKFKSFFLIVIIAFIFGLGGFFLGKNSRTSAPETDVTEETPSTEESSTAAESPTWNLLLHATVDKEYGMTSIPVEQPGWNHSKITYLGVSNVTIDIDGMPVKLEDAIGEGYVSFDQILSYARLDASMGFCKEISESENGLAKFTYRYPEFDLMYIYDIFEAPSGKQHLISEFGICASGRSPSFLYMDDETGKPIDYENWGLTFEVSEKSPTNIQIKCTQSGGQQVGNLIVNYYNLYKKNADAEEFMNPLVDDSQGLSHLGNAINMENTTDIFIDFSHLYGELSAGGYVLYLAIEDQYSKEDLHPLMRNFHDEQFFGIGFTIE